MRRQYLICHKAKAPSEGLGIENAGLCGQSGAHKAQKMRRQWGTTAQPCAQQGHLTERVGLKCGLIKIGSKTQGTTLRTKERSFSPDYLRHTRRVQLPPCTPQKAQNRLQLTSALQPNDMSGLQ